MAGQQLIFRGRKIDPGKDRDAESHHGAFGLSRPLGIIFRLMYCHYDRVEGDDRSMLTWTQNGFETSTVYVVERRSYNRVEILIIY